MRSAINLNQLTVKGSDREISEQISPISEGVNTRRTINGTLVNLASFADQKLSISVSCRDVRAPAFGNLSIGDTLSLVPISEFTHVERKPFGGFATQEYVDLNGTTHTDAVLIPLTKFADGTPVVKDVDGNEIPLIEFDGFYVVISDPGQTVYITYRPDLYVMVTGWSLDEDEADATVSWSLECEEI